MAANTSMNSHQIREQAISSKADSLFLLGHSLARLNAQGLFTGDLISSAFFSPIKGEWVIDAQHLFEDNMELEIVSRQFNSLHSTLDSAGLFALMSGYAQKSYFYFDPIIEGFTNRLLAQICPDAITPVSSPVMNFDMERILNLYGYTLAYKELQYSLVSVLTVNRVGDITEEEIVLTTVMLLAFRIDISQWIQQGEKISPDSEAFKILGALLRKDYTKEANFTGFIPKLLGIKGPKDRLMDLIKKRTRALSLLYFFVGQELDNPSQDMAELRTTIVLRPLNKAIFEANAHKYDHQTQYFIKAMSDNVIRMSSKMESKGNLVASLHMAQASQVFLQWIEHNWEVAEVNLVQAELNEEKFRWRHAIDMNEFDRDTFLNLCAYSNSATITDLLYFKHSRDLFQQKKTSNHLWSAVFRAIERQRWICRLSDVFIKSPLWDKEAKRLFLDIFTRNVKNFQSALAQHMRASQATMEQNVTSFLAQCWLEPEGQSNFQLNNELKQVTLLVDSLENSGLSETTLHLFQSLLELFPYIVIPSAEIKPSNLPDMISPSGQDSQSEIVELNELVSQFHAGTNPSVYKFKNLLENSRDKMMLPYCRLMIILLAPQENEWELSLAMVKHLYQHIPSAWDLPGIPINYLGNGMCEEILSIDHILDALRIAGDHFPSEQVVNKLIDRYLERYVAE